MFITLRYLMFLDECCILLLFIYRKVGLRINVLELVSIKRIVNAKSAFSRKYVHLRLICSHVKNQVHASFYIICNILKIFAPGDNYVSQTPIT